MSVARDAAMLPPKKLDAVEAARGLCASYVVLAHVFQIIGYRYDWKPEWPLLVNLCSGYAHEAVLFFFLLSGFSIHYVNVDRSLSRWAEVRHYLYLRWRRVYPIFAVTVLGILGLYGLGLALQLPHYEKIWRTLDWREVWATLGFVVDRVYVCGHWFEPMPTNPPFWSLSYEMSYYLIYPLFHALRRRIGIGRATIAGVALSLSAGAWNLHDCGHVSNVLSLYGYWCLGAWVAEHVRRGQLIQYPRSLSYLSPFIGVVLVWTFSESRLSDYDGLPWVFVLLPLLAYPVTVGQRQRLNGRQQGWIWATGTALVLAVLLLGRYKELAVNMTMFNQRLVLFWAAWTLLLGADGSAWLSRFADTAIKRIAWLGGISYALYLVHYPLLVFAREAVTGMGAAKHWALLVLPLVLGLAYLLEKQLQPRIVTLMETLLGRPREATLSIKN
ncbi:acyltransferase [Paucibacter sp. APW11]|uniref:Acyltransferase n=1 Tax=Roseateles aquae TaxID=3077235 RepID=A0ABU3P856_9BURK|nr:acyltransferase [Paucibacter sp. APW11]MDT8997931.1 acyltransferase [Paucibacter sp. APW11]